MNKTYKWKVIGKNSKETIEEVVEAPEPSKAIELFKSKHPSSFKQITTERLDKSQPKKSIIQSMVGFVGSIIVEAIGLILAIVGIVLLATATTHTDTSDGIAVLVIGGVDFLIGLALMLYSMFRKPKDKKEENKDEQY